MLTVMAAMYVICRARSDMGEKCTSCLGSGYQFTRWTLTCKVFSRPPEPIASPAQGANHGPKAKAAQSAQYERPAGDHYDQV